MSPDECFFNTPSPRRRTQCSHTAIPTTRDLTLTLKEIHNIQLRNIYYIFNNI